MCLIVSISRANLTLTLSVGMVHRLLFVASEIWSHPSRGLAVSEPVDLSSNSYMSGKLISSLTIHQWNHYQNMLVRVPAAPLHGVQYTWVGFPESLSEYGYLGDKRRSTLFAETGNRFAAIHNFRQHLHVFFKEHLCNVDVSQSATDADELHFSSYLWMDGCYEHALCNGAGTCVHQARKKTFLF